MKAPYKIFKTLMLLAVPALFLSTVHAQDQQASIKDAVAAKNFIFTPQTMLPTSGPSKQVGGQGYQLRISGDSLVSYLPYIGRAYSAPMNNNGGLNFTSTKFDYVVTDRKKGGWEVSIKPKDISDFREFALTVFENGSASLRAISNNRQPISFDGDAKPAK